MQGVSRPGRLSFVGRGGRYDERMKTIARSSIIGEQPHARAESDSAEAREVMASSSYSLKNMQNKQNQGVSPMNDTGVGRVSTSAMQNPATGR
jgi:hypothetical protein